MIKLLLNRKAQETDQTMGRQFSSVVVIINDEGKVLLLHRLDTPETKFRNQWGLPGGGSDIEENPTQTAIRETQEETGLWLEPDSLKLLHKKYKSGKNIYFFATYEYSGEVDIEKVTDEHQAYAWVDPNKLDMYHTADDVEFLVRKVFGMQELL
jgi:8-oxo-dGTP pyrophosphatase MutT (NUDIX family)